MQKLLAVLRSNWITATGAIITTLSLMAFVTTLIYVSRHGGAHGAYLGLFAFLLLPLGFVAGAVLIPIGLVVYRASFRQRMAELSKTPMRVLPVLAILTVVNLATVGTAGYEAAQYMDSPQFCGTVCHTVMSPTFETSLDAPHANVPCVSCHIGPGVKSFVQAKLTGLRQLVSIVNDDFPRPIPTPLHTVRPAREICEACHWPGKEKYNRLVVRPRFAEDDAVSPSFTVLMMKIGEKDADGVERGIHWHADPSVEITYSSEDGRRTIDWVRYVDGDGKERIFTRDGEGLDRTPTNVRQMDCIDCHNRPAHHQQEPDVALDRAIAAGKISRELPAIRRIALETLKKPWQRDRARADILADLRAAYAENGGIGDGSDELLAAAADAVAEIWLRNVHPDMNITWGTYPNYIGHVGCMRCHGGEHMDADGNIISFDCSACHTVLADNETEPQILEQLGITPR